MNDFVKMTDGFMQELELPESKPRVQTYETFYKQENDKPLEPWCLQFVKILHFVHCAELYGSIKNHTIHWIIISSSRIIHLMI